MCVIRDRNCLPFASTWDNPLFLVGPCCSSFKCSVVLFVFDLCLVFQMFPAPLDCPFLIALSIFFIVYSHIISSRLGGKSLMSTK